jgi:hypothetical protein
VKRSLLAAGIAVLAVATAASAKPAQTFTVINRTMVCATAFEGGVPDRLRSLWISVGRELGQGQGQFGASLAVSTGRDGSLVSIHADAASNTRPWLLVNRRRCKPIKSSFRAVREERTAATVEFNAECKLLDAPPRVLVRLRASMHSPTRWSRYKQEFLWARGNPLDASVSVRTYPGQRPIAFASYSRDGSARFYGAPRCTED